MKHWVIPVAGVVACFALAYFVFVNLPATFLPDEDQGALFVDIQLPSAASLDRTNLIVENVRKTLSETEGVQDVITVAGFSILQSTSTPNSAMAVAALTPWADRETKALQLNSIVNGLRAKFSQVPGANVAVFAPPAIAGMGAVGGLDFRLQALQGQPPQEIAQVVASLLGSINQRPEIAGAATTFNANVPQIYVDVDRSRAEALGLSVSDIYAAIGANFGSRYVNDFTLNGRVFQVNLQADSDFRAHSEDILASRPQPQRSHGPAAKRCVADHGFGALRHHPIQSCSFGAGQRRNRTGFQQRAGHGGDGTGRFGSPAGRLWL